MRPQFGAAISEIDFVVPFLNQYKVEPEPRVNSKLPDARIEIGTQSVHVKVISPEIFKPLSKLRGAMSGPNRIKDKIYDKFKHQLEECSSLDQPVILAIDMGNSELNYGFVESYLLGPLGFKAYFDQEKNKASHPHEDEMESMHGFGTGGLVLISAIVCYQTRFHDDLTFRTEGENL